MNAYTRMILDNVAGGTIKLSGLDAELPKAGYFVGGVVSPLVIEPENDSPADQGEALDAFIEYAEGHAVDADFLGWWTDEETGKLWVDATTWHETEFEAGRVGRERREIAIYDIAKQRELRLVYVEGE